MKFSSIILHRDKRYSLIVVFFSLLLLEILSPRQVQAQSPDCPTPPTDIYVKTVAHGDGEVHQIP